MVIILGETENREWKSAERALEYLGRADSIPHRVEGERVLLDQIPLNARRILDLGTGDGRLLALVRAERPESEGVALDFSETMLQIVRKRFAPDKQVSVIEHDLDVPLSSSKLGRYDAVVSSFAIHHLTHERKRQVYQEIFGLLNPGGVFCNLEHVASSTEALHLRFLGAIGRTPENEDKSNKLLDLETQLRWLWELGYSDVDCLWKWLEFALIVGSKA